MKLLIATPIFPPQIGGPATYTYELSSRLAKKNSVEVITFADTVKPIPSVSIKKIPLYAIPFGTFFRQLHFILVLLSKISSYQVLYIQSTIVVGVATTLLGTIVGKKKIVRFVGDMPWEFAVLANRTEKNLEDFYKNPLDFKSKVIRFFQKFTLNFAHKIIVPSVYLKKLLMDLHQIKPEKIVVINNAIEAKPCKVKKKKYQVVFVGRLVSWKNVDVIIEAVNLARASIPLTLVILGSGPEEKRLRHFVKNNKRESWVTFLGKVSKEKTHQVIAESQKLILYSSYEGLSHTAIEAMQLGTQVVASDIQANREALGKFGIFVPLNNTKVLSQALATGTQQLELAKKFAHKKYSWERHIKSLEALICDYLI